MKLDEKTENWKIERRYKSAHNRAKPLIFESRNKNNCLSQQYELHCLNGVIRRIQMTTRLLVYQGRALIVPAVLNPSRIVFLGKKRTDNKTTRNRAQPWMFRLSIN